MDAVTYPDENVIAFIQENLIPLKVPYDALPLSKEFNVKGTPTLITLGSDRKEHHRTVGFLGPEAFLASEMLGIGKYHFDHDRYTEAIGCFEKIISGYPQSDSAAEAVYHRGVSLYKSEEDRKYLQELYKTLSSRYPDSEWTRKAQPYKLI